MKRGKEGNFAWPPNCKAIELQNLPDPFHLVLFLICSYACHVDWLEFFWKSFFSNLLGQGIPFLNLPILAIFVDPTDLSLYLPTNTTYFRPNQFYRMDSTLSSTSTRRSQAALVEAEVEVEDQPTRQGRLRLRLSLALHIEHITLFIYIICVCV